MYSKNSKNQSSFGNVKCQSYQRVGHQCILIGQELLVLGGTAYNAQFLTVVLKINCRTLRCEIIPISNPLLLQGFSLFCFQNRVLVWGGSKPSNNEDGFKETSNQLWELDGSKFILLKQYGDIPSPRCFHSFTMCLEKYLIVFGGFDKRVYFNDWYILDCQTWVWRRMVATIQIRISYGVRMVWGGGRGILCSGCSFSQKYFFYSNQLYQFRIKDFKNPKVIIEPLCINSCMGPPPRSSPTLLCHNDAQLYFMGGEKIQINTQQFLNDVWILDLQTLKWKQCCTVLESKWGFEACAYQEKILLIGGVKNKTEFSSQIYLIDLNKQHIKSKLCRICENTLKSMNIVDKQEQLVLCLKEVQNIQGMSVEMMSKLSQSINPLNAVAMLIDNSINMSSTSISISLMSSYSHKYIFYCDNSSCFGFEDIEECMNKMSWKKGVISYDDKIDEQYAIWMEYGINYKFATLKLGDSSLYITKAVDHSIYCMYFSKTPFIHPTTNQNTHIYAYSIDPSGKYSSTNDRDYVLSFIASKIQIQELEVFDKITSKIFIFGVSDLGDNLSIFTHQTLIQFTKKQYLVPYIGRSIYVNQNLVTYDNIAQILTQKEMIGMLRQIQMKDQEKYLKKIAIYQIIVKNKITSQILIYHQNRLVFTIKPQSNIIVGFIEIPDCIEVNIFKSKIAKPQDQQKLLSFISKIQTYLQHSTERKKHSQQQIESYHQHRKYHKINNN